MPDRGFSFSKWSLFRINAVHPSVRFNTFRHMKLSAKNKRLAIDEKGIRRIGVHQLGNVIEISMILENHQKALG